MYREWKKTEFPKQYYICIWKQQDWEEDQEIDSKMKWGRMEEAPENGKELSHSAHADGTNEWKYSDMGIVTPRLMCWAYISLF